MSCVRCEGCDRIIDTDYDVECFMPDDSVACASCQDRRGFCEECEGPLDRDGACYREECRAAAAKEQASENHHNDPMRRW